MKVLKVVFEIPLADKNAVESLRQAGEAVAEMTKVLETAGFGAMREETIVTRPGRG